MRLFSEAKPIGLSPGTLVHIGRQKTDTASISVIDYNSESHKIVTNISPEQSKTFKNSDSVSWINICGIHQTDLISDLGQVFDLHALALEDILNTEHQPKCEEFDSYILLIFKLIHVQKDTHQLEQEQISMVIGPNWLLTFQEKPEDIFDRLRDRINRATGKIRQRGTDYLAYAILDSVVDSYFHILSDLGEQLEDIEESLLLDPEQNVLQEIHRLKQQMIMLRRSIWPLQIAITEFRQLESALLTPGTEIFLRDLLDHISHAVNSLELMRDSSANLLDLYLSLSSQKMNETMKVLTIMASLFIPLTFIAGIYGMNFENMPELKWAWGYPMVWMILISCASGMLWYFKRKKWF
ncbi:magnesium/cobalt transporter CorA [Geopsychrobacter electrodiphilus]|uniref:magnesium/cobalt transporter CorA n=1 Tax=Geopsychrobacter electrodiphilus TaxID=225196 RepID=UPI0003716B08|nr:magnesium/cobalt transporter CorA [Geopsychrobacter electrodiphilus]